jgi:hypothetical protein
VKTTFPMKLIVLLLALLPVAAMPLLGAWALVVSALVLGLLLVPIGPAWRRRHQRPWRGYRTRLSPRWRDHRAARREVGY